MPHRSTGRSRSQNKLRKEIGNQYFTFAGSGKGGAGFLFTRQSPKSALARDLGDCRDNKEKLAKRVFTCLTKTEFDAMMQNGLAQAKKNDSVSVNEAFQQL